MSEHPYPRERLWSDCEDELTTAYMTGYHKRDDEVAALKAEIERLRKELAEKDDYIRTVSRPIGAHSYE